VAERSVTSRALTVHRLPPHTAAYIREQGAVRGLFRDPLPEVTHGQDSARFREALFAAVERSRRGA
jgi:hypothetical protein